MQFLQYYYQSGCLYRLRALGERHTMDLTVGESGKAALLCGPAGAPQGPVLASGLGSE